MSHVGDGRTNNNFLQWNDTKNAWVSTVESLYAHLNAISSSGEAVVLAANSQNWFSFSPTAWVIAKGSATWQESGGGVALINTAGYAGMWVEAEVKASAFVSGFPATDPLIALAVGTGADVITGTTSFPKFEQRVEFAGPVTTNVMQFSLKNAFQLNQFPVGIYARSITSYAGALNLNFLTCQITIRPL